MRHDSIRSSRSLTILASAALLVSLAGCITVPPSPNVSSGKPQPLDFSELRLDDRLVTVAHPHGVNVIVELAEKDLPQETARRFLNEGQYHAAMFVNADGEHFRAGPHRFRYTDGRFRVGSSSYTPASNARLIIFKKRRGDMSFRLHQQRIVIPVEGTWQPALYYSIVNVTADGTPTNRIRKRRRGRRPPSEPVVTKAYPIEVLQIGTRKITVDSRDGGWRIDGRTFYPSADRNLILEGVAHFAEE